MSRVSTLLISPRRRTCAVPTHGGRQSRPPPAQRRPPTPGVWSHDRKRSSLPATMSWRSATFTQGTAPEMGSRLMGTMTGHRAANLSNGLPMVIPVQRAGFHLGGGADEGAHHPPSNRDARFLAEGFQPGVLAHEPVLIQFHVAQVIDNRAPDRLEPLGAERLDDRHHQRTRAGTSRQLSIGECRGTWSPRRICTVALRSGSLRSASYRLPAISSRCSKWVCSPTPWTTNTPIRFMVTSHATCSL